jgi:nucleoside-diphosphate-sugar epimerase
MKLFSKIARRRMVLVGKASNLIQPIYIGDLLTGLLRCAEAGSLEREVLQFAGPAPMTTRQMCAEVAHAVGASEPDLHLPLWGRRGGGRGARAVVRRNRAETAHRS